MFEIDKKKFGAFVSELRKEKGYTQKELAQKLFISDKAVSKWETAVSIPDTALLVPLAELLGVSVTELLMCERMKKEESMDAGQVESIVKTALSYSEEEDTRAYQTKNKWPIIYLFSVIIGCVGVWFCYTHQILTEAMRTVVSLGAVFGAYFCFLVKTKLPTFYDENRCGLYYDGAFRMNVPGVVFNNSNWPYVVRVGRIWACLSVVLYPIINMAMHFINPELWMQMELYVCLILLLGGLFISIYVVGKKCALLKKILIFKN